MRKVKFPVISIVLYVLAALLALYTIWAAIYSIQYIQEMIAVGQLVISGNEFEIANFLMTNFVQYAVFAITLFALGRILQINLRDFDYEEDEELFEEISDEDADEADEADIEEAEQSDDE
jgi:hypothetical protein